ncbi:MAG: hypothetical protein WA667_22780 [Candidatus Nitrosopolaris sp.]
MEGIYGDLVVLDSNFRLNGIESIIRYDKFTGIPYIKYSNYGNSNSNCTIDIDLLQVFAKLPVKYVIFKNRYKSLHLHDVSTALLGYGKLASEPGLLAISLVLRKNPEEYTQICKQSLLGNKLRLRKDDTLVYYKCDKQHLVYDITLGKDMMKKVHESDNIEDISYAEYKDMLIKSFKDILIV